MRRPRGRKGHDHDRGRLGSAGLGYPRVADASYADGVSRMIDGPDARYLSNRVFNDESQNVFSQGGVSHWGFVWGQFLDHTIGLREAGDEEAPLAFDADDPLESFRNDLGMIPFTRSAAADGTGDTTPREQVNLVSSFIDGWAVYGGDADRLDWLRVGSVDGDPTNNDATMLTTQAGYLPTVLERADATAAPSMELDGRLRLDPTQAIVAGDVRANENIGLTAVQTLFVREHNRIVAALPDSLDEQTKFEIARRVVAAEQQWIIYTEFLPAMGVDLETYTGYDESVDPSVTNEFATVGYQAHSMIHGEFELAAAVGTWSMAQLAAFEDAGIEVGVEDGEVALAIPLNVAFFNPQLLPELGLGNVLSGLASEAEYRNDEQIDDQLRSVLFQIPAPGAADPAACLDGEDLPDCFAGVVDLGVLGQDVGDSP